MSTFWKPGIPDASQSPVWILLDDRTGRRRAALAYWDDGDGDGIKPGWCETRDVKYMDWCDDIRDDEVVGWRRADIPAEVRG